jgi:PAS domain S-box-containing protein
MPGRYPREDDEPQVLEALTEAVYIIEADGRIQFCNAALAQLTGYAVSTLLGRPSLDLYAPEDQLAVLDRRTRAFRGEPGPSLLEATLVRHDGVRVPVELSLSSLWRDGQVMGRVTVLRDISARKQAEAALHASEERFRLLVEGVQDYAIYLLDPEGASPPGTRAPSASKAIVRPISSASPSAASFCPTSRRVAPQRGSWSMPPVTGIMSARAGGCVTTVPSFGRAW